MQLINERLSGLCKLRDFSSFSSRVPHLCATETLVREVIGSRHERGKCRCNNSNLRRSKEGKIGNFTWAIDFCGSRNDGDHGSSGPGLSRPTIRTITTTWHFGQDLSGEGEGKITKVWPRPDVAGHARDLSSGYVILPVLERARYAGAAT